MNKKPTSYLLYRFQLHEDMAAGQEQMIKHTYSDKWTPKKKYEVSILAKVNRVKAHLYLQAYWNRVCPQDDNIDAWATHLNYEYNER